MFGRLTLLKLLFTSILLIAGRMYINQLILEQYYQDQMELKEKLKLA
ncbi:protein PIGBOS1-like [Meles meles]|nr:protein PIGBOS1-like [Meles meles]